MTVYRFIGFPDMDAIDGGHDFQLPWVRCDRCGQHWGNGDFSFPAFEFDSANPIFTNERCEMTPDELESVRRNILQQLGRQVWMPPHSSLGPYVGTSHTLKLKDFVDAGGGALLISRTAHAKLKEIGIDLMTGPAHVRCRGKMLDTHLVLHIEPVTQPVLHPTTVKALTYTYCPHCGGKRKSDLRAEVKLGEYKLRKDRVPKGATLFRPYEWHQILATEAFVEAVAPLELKGATFKPWGEVV